MKSKQVWQLSENEVTSEEIYQSRREILKGMGFGLAAFGGASLVGIEPLLAAVAGLPAKKNDSFKVNESDRSLTLEKHALSYNNFYEFSLDKNEVQNKVQSWNPTAWKVKIGGLVKKPLEIDIEDLCKKLAPQMEERIYRFRCVEAWSMVLPWSGFSLSHLIKMVEPKAEAKYIQFTSLGDKKVMPNIAALPHYPWPYTEGLTIEEGMNELAFMATGLYGKALPKQNGAPFRLVVPWKYGFKGAKSIVSIDFVATQPKTLWNELAPSEYGFYANVNPEVDHPRWSQGSERVVDGSFFPKKIKTLKFNGYEAQVAGLYKGLDLKKNF